MNKKVSRSPKSAQRMDCELTANPAMRSTVNAETDAIASNFPKGVSRPALRALLGAGYRDLKSLTKARKADVLAWHGMGPKALGLIEAAMKERGLKFRA